ncbi:hypothetical protein NFI96_005622 [Prochilodus magdalenae]|nr:hypothetical protein NFI96_005622 [Prochilodus magdalenae]
MQQEIQDMLSHGIISPSHSPWAAPVVLVRKKDGTLRFCVDYRKLNDVTVKDAYPLPRIDDALDSLTAAKWFSTLDLASGYWQVEIDAQDKEKTAFATRTGFFEFNVLPFGLCNAPSTFQRLMELVLADLQWTSCLIYLDDIIVFGKTFEEHLGRLQVVLEKLKAANLKVKPSKCQLFAKEVQYLGHIISANGIMTDPGKVAVVKEWKVPRSQTEVRSFLGLASYYRRFVQDFATIARPLHKLTEKGAKMVWSAQCQDSFEELKRRLTMAPILAFPDPDKPFLLDTDASDVGIGGVLSQIVDGRERVIAYASRALSRTERNYATTKKELLAVVIFMKQFRHYLLGRRFTLRTDHSSLRWLHSFDQPEGQIARWLEQLASFDYDIVHRPGKSHGNADALSRVPITPESRAVVGQVYEDSEGDGQEWDWRLEQAKDDQLQKIRDWVETHGPKPPEEVKRDPQLRAGKRLEGEGQSSEGRGGGSDSRCPPAQTDVGIPATWWVMQRPRVQEGALASAGPERPTGGVGLVPSQRNKRLLTLVASWEYSPASLGFRIWPPVFTGIARIPYLAASIHRHRSDSLAASIHRPRSDSVAGSQYSPASLGFRSWQPVFTGRARIPQLAASIHRHRSDSVAGSQYSPASLGFRIWPPVFTGIARIPQLAASIHRQRSDSAAGRQYSPATLGFRSWQPVFTGIARIPQLAASTHRPRSDSVAGRQYSPASLGFRSWPPVLTGIARIP